MWKKCKTYCMYKDIGCGWDDVTFLSLLFQYFQILVVLGQLNWLPKTPCKSKPFSYKPKSIWLLQRKRGTKPNYAKPFHGSRLHFTLFLACLWIPHHPPPLFSFTSRSFSECHFWFTPSVPPPPREHLPSALMAWLRWTEKGCMSVSSPRSECFFVWNQIKEVPRQK